MVMCYSLRDFAIHSGSISEVEMNELIGRCKSMRLCRDICNRAKHLTLKQKSSVDATWSLGREWIPWVDGAHKYF